MTTASQKGILTPVNKTENLTAGQGRQPKPKGVYYGTIRKPHVRDLPYLEGRSQEKLTNQGFSSSEVVAMALEIGDLQPQEDQELPNAAPFFTPDIIIQDGEYHVTNPDIPEQFWQIRRSQDALGAIFGALGVAEQVETPEGVAYAWTADMLDALEDGEFNGQDIGFDLQVEWYSTREDRQRAEEKGTTPEKNGFNENVKQYLPVV